MRSLVYGHLSDDELFSEILRKRAAGSNVDRPLGELCERWRRPAAIVIRKIQSSYRARSEADEQDFFQEAVGKLVARGLDQFHGISQKLPGQAASPRAFFLRIVKHVAIDHYRRPRELLAPRNDDADDVPENAGENVAAAIQTHHELDATARARETYQRAWARLQKEHPNEAGAWDLYHHQDLDDHEQVAARLGISLANSYKRVSRAQAYLKLYVLEDDAEEEGR